MELLEIRLLVDPKVAMETTSRMGICNKKKKIIYPSAYIYHANSKYYLVHFKQLFQINRSKSYDNMGEEDITRLKSIAFCLKNWGLIEIDDKLIEPHNKFIFVLPFGEKKNWKIFHKFNLLTLNQ